MCVQGGGFNRPVDRQRRTDVISRVKQRLSSTSPYVWRKFPFIELQTNGIRLADEGENIDYDYYMASWYEMGLTTICLSMVHYDNVRNAELSTTS